MKHKILFWIRPLSILPALFMLSVIFGFSAQTGETSGSLSYHISYQIVETSNELFHLELDEDELSHYAHGIEVPLRKTAHMAEYFVLTLTILFPLYVYGRRGASLFVAAALLSVGFACTDEFHQYFVSERSASIIDVGIDSIGVACALIATRVGGWVRNSSKINSSRAVG
ncbi:MAG: VanZ family protein [Ruminococcus sp.]|nr:VanZ family protein [Ruminococcus sp.]